MPVSLFTGDDISLNGITFNHLDDSGCIWFIEDIDGWWGLPDLEAFDDPRSYIEDGSYFAAGRYSPRTITITGHILPPYDGMQAVVAARNALNNALDLVRQEGSFQVNEGPDKYAMVQVAGRPLTAFDKINNVLNFSIQLRAADPRKFAVEQSLISIDVAASSDGRRYNKNYPVSYGEIGSDGTASIFNEGNYNTPATFRINGPVQNPIISHIESGKDLLFDVDLAIDDYVDVDLRARTVIRKGGVSGRSTLLAGSEWFTIDPGNNTVKFSGYQTIAPRDASPALTNYVPNPAWADVNVSGTPDGEYINSAVTVQSIGFDGPNTNRRVRYVRSASSGGSGLAVIQAGGDTTVPSLVPQLTASSTYTASVWVRAPKATQVVLRLATPGTTTGTASGVYSLVPNQWTQLSVTGTTGAAQTTGAVSIEWKAVDPGYTDATGDTLDVSSAMINDGSILYNYFDGDSAFSVWTGTANASTSTQQALTYVPKAMVQFRYHSAWIY